MAGVAHQWQNMLQTHLGSTISAVEISSQGDGRIDIRIESIHALLAKNILKMIYNVHKIIPSNHLFSVGVILQSIFDIEKNTKYIIKWGCSPSKWTFSWLIPGNGSDPNHLVNGMIQVRRPSFLSPFSTRA